MCRDFKPSGGREIPEPLRADLSVVFTQDRTMNILRVTLLDAERHRYSDETYINGLVSAYHRTPGHFAQKRKVSAA